MDARTKVVVRKLPPSVAEADVRQLVDALAGGQYTWFSFVQGKTSAKRLVHSRCYVNFADPGAIPAFKRAVEAHAFVTERGAQYRGCVEYAPFQKVPEQRVKRDPREGTLDADPEYQAFVERLNAEPAALPSAAAAPPLAVPASAKSGGEVVVTPLMAYLREKHAQRGRPSKAEAPNNHDKKRGGGKAKALTKDESSDYQRAPPTAVLANKGRRGSEDAAPAAAAAKRGAAPADAGRSAPAAAAARPPRAPKQAPASSSSRQSPRGEKPGDSGAAAAPDQAADSGADAPQKGSAGEQPERVRAGFGLYQPKRRGRLSEAPDEAASTSPPPGAGGNGEEAAGAGQGGSKPNKDAPGQQQRHRRPSRDARRSASKDSAGT